MISKAETSTSKQIKDIIKELTLYQNKDKKAILNIRIEERLNKSLREYYKQLTQTLDKLYIYSSNNNELKLAKKLNKE